MKKILFIATLAVALFVGVTFTVKNSQIVELMYYFGLHWEGPLSWLVIMVFVCGLIVGIAGVKIISMKRKLLSTSNSSKTVAKHVE